MNIYDECIEKYTKKGLLKEVYNDGVMSITSINGKMYGVHDYRTDNIAPTSFGLGNIGHIAKISGNPDLYYEFLESGLMSLYDVQNINELLNRVAELDPSKLKAGLVDPEKEAEAFSELKISYANSRIPMRRESGKNSISNFFDKIKKASKGRGINAFSLDSCSFLAGMSYKQV